MQYFFVCASMQGLLRQLIKRPNYQRSELLEKIAALKAPWGAVALGSLGPLPGKLWVFSKPETGEDVYPYQGRLEPSSPSKVSRILALK